jgi:TM2 domain-containing membrane protein YozV
MKKYHYKSSKINDLTLNYKRKKRKKIFGGLVKWFNFVGTGRFYRDDVESGC